MRAAAIALLGLFGATFDVSQVRTDRISGERAVPWESGFDCGSSHKCFRIYQSGNPGYRASGCRRKIILQTIILDPPSGVDQYELTRASGNSRLGLQSVKFESGLIVIQTYITLRPIGHFDIFCNSAVADFEIRFGSSNGRM